MKGCTIPQGSTPPILYEQQCGLFYVPQESDQWIKGVWDGAYGFSPLSEKTRMCKDL